MSVYACDVLTRFGLLPAFAAGHSYGEHVALSAMGLLSRDDLLRSSAIRGRAVHEAGRDHPGGMAAVAASEEETRTALDALGIPATIANVNAPRQVVIAGPVDAIDAALKRLPERGLAVRRVAVTAAFHSASMEQPSVSFGEHLEKLEMHVPRIPVYSNINAEPYPADVEAIRKQMSVHLARPVRFVDQIRAMHRDGARIFFEVGPGRILTGLVKRILEGRPHVAVAIDRPADSAWQSLGELLAQAHALGLPLDLTPWFEKRGFDAGDPLTYLREVHDREAGRPTDWIVDSAGARPPGSLPESQRKPAIDAPAVIGTAERGETPEKMSQNNASDQKRRPQLRPEGSRADPALLRQLNDAMSGWLELQKEQQRLSERFLALQERIVAGMFGDESPVAESPRAEARRDETAPGLAVPPAPVLPDLRPAPTLPEVDPELLSPTTDRGVDHGEQAPAEPLAPTGDDGLSVEQFRVDLLAEISRRTGYPEDMLDLDVPLEGGLGIDSIKTMEVFGALKKYHAVLSDEGELDEEVLVQLSQFRTLREFLVYYGGRLSRIEEPVVETAGTQTAAAPATSPDTAEERIERLVLRSVPAPRQEQPRSGELPSFPRGQIMLVLGEPRDLASSFDAALSATGHRVVRVVPGNELRSLGDGRYEVDLSDPDMLRRLAERLRGSESARVGVLVNLLGLADPLNRPGLNGAEAPLRLLQWLTNVAQVFEQDLRSNGDGDGWLINVTSFDGRFGLRGSGELPVAQASSLGFFKSMAREWRDVRVKNFDLDPRADPRTMLAGLLQEMADDDDTIEVGLDAQGRWHLELVETPPEVDADPRRSRSQLPLDRESVVLATGGADGITAEVVKRLARESGTRLVIVGRTEIGPAAAEPEETQAIEDEQELRNVMIRRLRAADPGVTPAEVESEVQRILKQRRIRSNLEAIRTAGSEVEYHTADVRDEEVLGALIDSLYTRLGRIDGVLHGAGVVEDCRLRDKTPESLARVFRTKAGSAHILARKLQPETLRFLVFFSSVSGRFGNAGQTDYSAANEYLNKLASHLDRQWPGRVVAVNWGPWDGGMVAAGLRTAYSQRGIGMIRAEAGARSLLEELCLESSSASEVVLACTPQRIAGFDEHPA
jgi:NAD(P)-dependent dehydrogenase (short-subunit alcohol dehydrogenase family)